MSLISHNLKYLRKQTALTQEQMATELGIKRSLLGAYEEGRADPRISNLIRFAEIFSLSVDQLVKTDLSKGAARATQPEKGGAGDDLRILSITVDSRERENIEIVPQKAAAGYLNGYADPEYMQDLPKFHLPVLPTNATYRAFEISGDSMLPLRSGTIVIGQYVEELSLLKNGQTYVLLTREEGVVYKRVYRYADNADLFSLSSDNQQYSTYDVHGKDLLEVWEAKAYIGMEFPEPMGSDEMNLKKLTDMVLQLQQEVIKMKK
jgi:transcriptional regulator with XRE-family HTH domain